MFHRRIWRYKWIVLEPFEKHLGGVKFSEITGPHEKRYQFDPAVGDLNSPLCVSIAYARRTWQGETKPCSKAKATHLIVRPHLRKEYSKPLSNSAWNTRNVLYRFKDRLSGSVKHFTGETETSDSLVQWVGIELVLSVADIKQSPDQTYSAWQNVVSPNCSEYDLISPA